MKCLMVPKSNFSVILGVYRFETITSSSTEIFMIENPHTLVFKISLLITSLPSHLCQWKAKKLLNIYQVKNIHPNPLLIRQG